MLSSVLFVTTISGVGRVIVICGLGVDEDVAGQTRVVHNGASGIPDDGVFLRGRGAAILTGTSRRNVGVSFSVCVSEDVE